MLENIFFDLSLTQGKAKYILYICCWLENSIRVHVFFLYMCVVLLKTMADLETWCIGKISVKWYGYYYCSLLSNQCKEISEKAFVTQILESPLDGLEGKNLLIKISNVEEDGGKRSGVKG